MRSYQTCSGCDSYVQLEELRAPCQLCGVDMCVRCAKECQECGKEICRKCYRGKGLCRTCSPMAYAKNAWKQTDNDDDLTKAGNVVKAIGGFIFAAHEREVLGRERRENENERSEKRKKLEAQYEAQEKRAQLMSGEARKVDVFVNGTGWVTYIVPNDGKEYVYKFNGKEWTAMPK